MGSKNKRKFIIGSEWLYLKIYSSPLILDKLLIKDLHKIIELILKAKLAKNFFFVRYEDPNFHIRFRFYVEKKENIFEILNLFSKFLSKKKIEKEIFNFQIETYKRELERYGEENIEAVEKLFYLDSLRILKILQLCTKNAKDARWIFALATINHYFNLFGFDREQRLLLIKNAIKGFKSEFGINSSAYTKLLMEKYKYNKSEINDFFIERKIVYTPYFKFNEKYFKDQKYIIHNDIIINSSQEKNNLASNLIHMSLNRLFIFDSRLSELVSYEYILKFYNELMNNSKYQDLTNIIHSSE